MRCTPQARKLHARQGLPIANLSRTGAAARVMVARDMMGVQNLRTFATSWRYKCNCCISSWIDTEEPKDLSLLHLEGQGVRILETQTTFLLKPKR
mmetsp:Transcript_30068/g.68050  ORF Transcript_30068/g.68050 Transcript_30068/m.68050 type:complete len:95 (-) Transcript_30068:425-709(-)